MDMVALAIAVAGGLACLALGLRALLRGKPVATSTGRIWRSAKAAGAFCFLLGLALLTFPLLTLGAHTGVIGADAGFWLSGVPLVLAVAAVAAFRPRRP